MAQKTRLRCVATIRAEFSQQVLSKGCIHTVSYSRKRNGSIRNNLETVYGKRKWKRQKHEQEKQMSKISNFPDLFSTIFVENVKQSIGKFKQYTYQWPQLFTSKHPYIFNSIPMWMFFIFRVYAIQRLVKGYKVYCLSCCAKKASWPSETRSTTVGMRKRNSLGS